MSDLVSREAVSKIIYDIKCNDDIPKNYGTLLDIIYQIMELPVVYDVDNVVTQLENIRIEDDCPNCVYREKCNEVQDRCDPSDKVDLCGLTTRELAIEIVRKGGV